MAVREDVHQAAIKSFSAIARMGILNMKDGEAAARDPASDTPLSRWMRARIRIGGNLAARKMREAARLKALQRTPYPMVGQGRGSGVWGLRGKVREAAGLKALQRTPCPMVS